MYFRHHVRFAITTRSFPQHFLSYLRKLLLQMGTISKLFRTTTILSVTHLLHLFCCIALFSAFATFWKMSLWSSRDTIYRTDLEHFFKSIFFAEKFDIEFPEMKLNPHQDDTLKMIFTWSINNNIFLKYSTCSRCIYPNDKYFFMVWFCFCFYCLC
jgi:hypothetical protein